MSNKTSHNNKKQSIQSIEKIIHSKFQQNYVVTPTHHLTSIIDNIIYNEKSHIVAIFKDYLILDDISEFLKRYYTRSESAIRLPRFFEYYETYSKIFPNYTSIFEGKYIYRNIQRKQRMIDLQEKMEMEAQKNKKFSLKQVKKDKEPEVFVTEVYDSIMNDTNRENIGNIFGVIFTQKELQDEDANFFDKVNSLIEVVEKQNSKIHTMQHQGKLVLRHTVNSNIVDDNNHNTNVNSGNISHRKMFSNTERTLEVNETNNLNHINNNNNTKRLRQNEPYNSTILSTKMNELKKLYHKKINSYNLIHQKLNQNNNYLSFPHSPNTERIIPNKNHSKADSISKNKNANNINNIVYIINQNPKITNHINIYNNLTNNNSVSSRNRNNPINSTSKNNTNVNIRQLLLSGKNKTKNSSPNKNFIFSSSMKRISSNVNNNSNNNNNLNVNNTNSLNQNKKPIKKRNITSSYINSNSLTNNNNNNMMRTVRDMNYKIAEMLKKHEMNYQSQQNLLRTARSNSNNSKNEIAPKATTNKEEKGKISRNKRAISHERHKSNDNYFLSGNKKYYYMSKNDSINKIQQQFNSGGRITNTNMNNTMMKKKIIKGIQIKNFNKIYMESVSVMTNNVPKSHTNRTKKIK